MAPPLFASHRCWGWTLPLSLGCWSIPSDPGHIKALGFSHLCFSGPRSCTQQAGLNESLLDKLPGQSEGPLRQVIIQKEIKIWIMEGVAARAEKQKSYACRPEQEDTQTGFGPSSSKPLKNAGPLQGWGEE